MATIMKKVDMIHQIVHLKQFAKRWKAISLLHRPVFSHPDFDSNPPRRTTLGFFAVYVGAERIRFVIPTHFLSLPIFVALLNKAKEFGFQARGGLVLPCEVGFFRGVLRILEEDEQRFRGWELDDVLQFLQRWVLILLARMELATPPSPLLLLPMVFHDVVDATPPLPSSPSWKPQFLFGFRQNGRYRR